MRTDKSPCPLGWDPGGNIYPVSRGLLPFAVSSEKQYLFVLWILILYVAKNAFIETEVLSIKGKKLYKNVGYIKSLHCG